MSVLFFSWGCRSAERPIHGGLEPLLEAISEAGVDVDQLGCLMVDGMMENLTFEDAETEFSKRPDDFANSVIGVKVDMESNDSLKRLSDSIENQGGWTPQCWVYVSRSGYRYARMNVDFSHRGRRSDGDLYVVFMLWFLEGDHAVFVDEKIGPFNPDHIEVADDKIRHITGEEWATYWIGKNVVFIHRVDDRKR